MKFSIEAFAVIVEALELLYETADENKRKDIDLANEELDNIGTY